MCTRFRIPASNLPLNNPDTETKSYPVKRNSQIVAALEAYHIDIDPTIELRLTAQNVSLPMLLQDKQTFLGVIDPRPSSLVHQQKSP